MEQHILCRQTELGEDRLTPGDGGCKRGTWSLANATSEADPAYLSGFYGKWHSGSLSNTSGSGDCYEVDGGVDCLEGYMRFGSDVKSGRASCCQGADGLSWPGNPSFTNKALGISHPLHFGFSDEQAGLYYGLFGTLISVYGFAMGVIIDNLGVRLSLLVGGVLPCTSPNQGQEHRYFDYWRETR